MFLKSLVELSYMNRRSTIFVIAKIFFLGSIQSPVYYSVHYVPYFLFVLIVVKVHNGSLSLTPVLFSGNISLHTFCRSSVLLITLNIIGAMMAS